MQMWRVACNQLKCFGETKSRYNVYFSKLEKKKNNYQRTWDDKKEPFI